MNILPALSIILVSVLASELARRVPDEMRYLEKTLRILQAISGSALLFVLPWWLALIITGGLALGWLPMAGAIGVLAAIATGPEGASVAAIAFALALLSGARWTLDKRKPIVYATAVVAFTLLFTGLYLLGAF